MMTLYECAGCAYCKVVRHALKDKGIDFVELVPHNK